jgi:hypothetical protein
MLQKRQLRFSNRNARSLPEETLPETTPVQNAAASGIALGKVKILSAENGRHARHDSGGALGDRVDPGLDRGYNFRNVQESG